MQPTHSDATPTDDSTLPSRGLELHEAVNVFENTCYAVNAAARNSSPEENALNSAATAALTTLIQAATAMLGVAVKGE